MPRERDYAYEALAETTGTDMSAGRGELNAALKSIREQSEIEDSYILADEIHARAKMYRDVYEGMTLTPTALSKHWLRVFEETQTRKPKATNQSALPSECATCDGDRFVLVALRKPTQSVWAKERGREPSEQGIEEYAPCPDCGLELRPSRRSDGSMSVPPDPAAVREMMRQ